MDSNKRSGKKDVEMRSSSARKLNSPQEFTRKLLGNTSTIRFDPIDAVAGFEVLLHNGQVRALPNDTYVVGPEHIALLDEAGIPYVVEG